MTLRIDNASAGATPTVRLIGRIRSEHLDAVRTELDNCPPPANIDLSDVTTLDVEAVRFLSGCELEGYNLLGCPPFIREWIQREREAGRAK
ncbi:MAG: hypothetical protein JSU00_25490 [Acidobacteria bacterium]|nr:hypothetical protein [Acidobacteriota bacterium]